MEKERERERKKERGEGGEYQTCVFLSLLHEIRDGERLGAFPGRDSNLPASSCARIYRENVVVCPITVIAILDPLNKFVHSKKSCLAKLAAEKRGQLWQTNLARETVILFTNCSFFIPSPLSIYFGSCMVPSPSPPAPYFSATAAPFSFPLPCRGGGSPKRAPPPAEGKTRSKPSHRTQGEQKQPSSALSFWLPPPPSPER